MTFKPLTEIKKRPVKDVVGSLKADNQNQSIAAGQVLCQEAKAYGLDLKDYLILSVDTTGEGKDGLDGFELALAELNLPVRNDFRSGALLQAANDTFQFYPGTRVLFPPVIDTVVRWATRQDLIETTAPIVSQSRQVSAVEMISIVVNDDSNDRDTVVVPEAARIPVRTIMTTENAVRFYKHGSGLRTTYEFQRRVGLDILTPFIARVTRELERSKVAAVTNLLINGDAVNAAAPVVTQSSYNTKAGVTATANTLSWQNFLAFLVDRARNGTPVDTVVGNYDAAFSWAMLFQIPLANASGTSAAENLARTASAFTQMAIPFPTFAISSSAPASKLIGITKAETAEELVEAGSTITDSEKAITNQTMVYTKTENTGYRLTWGDTRAIYDFGS